MLDCKQSWAPKNWYFWTVVLEKTLENPLDCKEIQPVHPKGDQSWVSTGRTDIEAETPKLWPPDAKNWLIWKDPDAGKDWRLEQKGTTEDEMVGWHHRLNGHGFAWTRGVGDGQGGLACWGSQRVRHDWVTELNWTESYPALVMLETLETFNSSPGVPGGRLALTYVGIHSPEGYHTSACLGIHQPGIPGSQLACLDLPRDLVPGRLSRLNLLRDPPVQGSQVNMPWPAQGPNSQEAILLLLAQGFDTQEAIMPQLAWDLHPDPGTPGSQVATALGRISFRNTHPKESPSMEMEGSLLLWDSAQPQQ